MSFYDALAPILEAARSDETVAARAFANARVRSDEADGRVATICAEMDAVVANAARVERARSACPAEVANGIATLRYGDREGCLEVLARRRSSAENDAQASARECETARERYDACVRRRRTFEAHRARKRAAFDRARDRAEAASFDESNASGHEARLRSNGNDDA